MRLVQYVDALHSPGDFPCISSVCTDPANQSVGRGLQAGDTTSPLGGLAGAEAQVIRWLLWRKTQFVTMDA